MNRLAHLKTARGWSWVFAALSWLPVAFCGYGNWRFSEFAAERAREGQFVCGNSIMALFLVCAVAAMALATLAVALGTFSFCRLASPRAPARKWELLLVGGLFAVGALACVVLAVANGGRWL